jgi:hypothetical protein
VNLPDVNRCAEQADVGDYPLPEEWLHWAIESGFLNDNDGDDAELVE